MLRINIIIIIIISVENMLVYEYMGETKSDAERVWRTSDEN